MKRVGIFCLVFLLLASPSWAAIAFDAASGNSKAGGSGTTLTIAHTATGTGTTGLLVVGCALSTGGGSSFSGVTWNGTALTQLQTLAAVSGRVDIWYLKAPAAGTFNVVATETGNLNTTCNVITYTGVDQSTPFGTQVTGTNSNSAVSTTVTTATGQVVVDIAAWPGASSCGAEGANQTQRDVDRIGGTMCSAMSEQAGADGGVMSWSQNGPAGWLQIAVPILPASTRKPQAPMILY